MPSIFPLEFLLVQVARTLSYIKIYNLAGRIIETIPPRAQHSRIANLYRSATYYRLGQNRNKSDAIYNDILHLHITDKKDFWFLGRSAEIIGDSQLAIDYYEQFAGENGADAETHKRLATIYKKLSRPSTAGRIPFSIRHLESATSLNPKDHNLWHQLGTDYLRVAQYKKALDAFENANSLRNASVKEKFSFKALSIVDRIRTNIGHANILYRAVSKIRLLLIKKSGIKKAIPIWYGIAISSQYTNNIAKRNKYYDLCVLHSTSRRINKFGIAALHEKYKNWFLAIESYKTLDATLDADHSVALNLAKLNKYIGHLSKAEYYYREALRRGADPFTCHYNIAVVSERQDNYIEAITNYKKASLAENTFFPKIQYRIGLLLFRLHKYHEACEEFSKIDLRPSIQKFKISALNLEDNNESLFESFNNMAKHWFRKAITCEEAGFHEAAADNYIRGVNRLQHHALEPIYAIASLYYKEHNFKKAALYYSRLLIDQENYDKPRQSILEHTMPAAPISYIHYSKTHKIRKNIVVYQSYEGLNVRGNPRAIYKKRRLFDPDGTWDHVWIIDDELSIPSSWINRDDTIFIKKGSNRHAFHMATAEYFITNASAPSYIARREGQYFLNTWHGTPLKFVGKDDQSRFNGRGATQRLFLHTTHIVSPNHHTTNILKRAWDQENTFAGKIAETGYPRIDLTLNCDDRTRNTLRDRLRLNKSKQTVLYAPTFRGSRETTEDDISSLKRTISILGKHKINILIRAHYFAENKLGEESFPCTVVPNDIDTNELLSVVDILITDYCSIFFDFIPTGRKIIHYIYDYEKYIRDRGLYFDKHQFPGIICSTEHELDAAISDQQITSFDLSKFNYHDDGKSTERVIKFFFGGDDSHVKNSKVSKKKNILINGGSFNLNGITTSLISLVQSLDKSTINPVITFTPKAIAKSDIKIDLVNGLNNQGIDLLPRYGKHYITRDERHALNIARRQKFRDLPHDLNRIIKKCYQREFNRLFGDMDIYAVIDYTGYEQFWGLLFAYSRNCHRKIIYMHNDMQKEWEEKFNNIEITFNNYQKYDILVSVSKASCETNKENLAEKYHIEKNKFTSIDNSINIKEIKLKSKEKLLPYDNWIDDTKSPIFLNIGRLSAEKNHEMLIRAFEGVCRINADAILIIIGIGVLQSKLRKLIMDLQLDKNIYLLGQRTNPFPILARADCFVLSSTHEGKPVTIYEAMALGIPVISTSLDGTRDALKDGGGKLVQINVGALESAMTHFIEHGPGNIGSFDLDKYNEDAIMSFYTTALKLPYRNKTAH